MVHHNSHHILLGAHRIDLRTNRNLGRQIKPVSGQRHQLVDHVPLGHRDHGRAAAPPHPRLGRQHLLHRHPFNLGKYRAQRFVAGDHVIKGRIQRLDIEPPADPKRGRHVVGRNPALEPVQEPQPALRE
ncbi:hypothetical protein MMAN_16120 [Mycobacterium mantenii]|uniref:Uncharacterized protein n=1 Tax=Mycobacterium mantenii TaxID=560555 RepID=A0ABN6A6H4_MYCNT|nr:hypothetical protein MMAN_16120 [Mycobacterium mantenii]